MSIDLQRIDHYLADTLQGKDLEDFELQLLTDVVLQEAVKEQMQLKAAFHSHFSATEKVRLPPLITAPRIVPLDSVRGEEQSVLLKKEEAVLLSIDVGPDSYLVSNVRLTDETQAVFMDEEIVSDDEGLLDVMLPALERGKYFLRVTTKAVNKNWNIEVG